MLPCGIHGVARDERILKVGGETMAGNKEGMKIVLQVGAELRIRNNGDIIMDNPELELAKDDKAADVVLLYRFDGETGEHILRLVEPVADHKHVKVHRPND